MDPMIDLRGPDSFWLGKGVYKTFEKADRINSALVIATQGEKIYITHQTQPGKNYRYYSFLGGMVPRGVKELIQAQNELLEESGMTSADRSLWKIYTSGTPAIDRETHRRTVLVLVGKYQRECQSGLWSR